MDELDRAQQENDFYEKVALLNHKMKVIRHTPDCTRPINRDCLGCGEPIPEKRLKALPAATRCVVCQALAESRGEMDE